MSVMDAPIDRLAAAVPAADPAKSRTARAVPFISWVALALMTTSSYKDSLRTAEVAG